MATNIILSPHLDDAALDCWHLLTRQNTIVLNIFTGAPPAGTTTLWDLLCGEADSHKMIALRKEENEKAFACSGNPNPQLFLDILDAQYRSTNDHPDIPKLAYSIEKMSPPGSTYYAPLAISRLYRHPDHVLARKIGLELHKRGHRVGFFPDYLYMSLPHRLNDAQLHRLQARAEKALNLKLSREATYLNDAELAKRRLALRSYKTQYAALNTVSLGAMTRLVRRNYEVVFTPS